MDQKTGTDEMGERTDEVAEPIDPRRKFLLLAAAGIVGESIADSAPAGASHTSTMELGHSNQAFATTGLRSTLNGDEVGLDVQAENGAAALRAGGRPATSNPDNLTVSPSIGLWAHVDAERVNGTTNAPSSAAVFAHGQGGAAGVDALAEVGPAVIALAQTGDGLVSSGDTGVIGLGHETGVDGRGPTIGARGAGRLGVVGISVLDPNADPGASSTITTVLDGSASAGVIGIGAESQQDLSTGVLGVGDVGVVGRAFSDLGTGLRGEAPTGTGVSGQGATGVLGTSDSADGQGVHGENTNGAGVRGDGTTGVHGRSQTADGQGVHGENGNGAGVRGDGATGVHGRSDAADGHGVRGENANGAGVRGDGATGVHGRSDSAGGRGIHGEASQADGAGVRGDNPNGDAVRGEGRTGIHGRSDSAGGRGIHGEASQADGAGVRGDNPNGVGVRADGRTAVEAVAPQGGVGVRAVVGQGGQPQSMAARATLATAEDPSISVGIVAIGDVGLDVTGTESALHVRGKACFDATGRSGRSNGTATVPVVPRSTTSVDVKDIRVTDDSIIHLMLATDPGRGPGNSQISVSWINVVAGVGFDVYLTNPAQRDVQFRYFITEPC